MPARTDDRSDGYFAPPQVATGELRRTVLVVAAGRMQADSLRHQLTTHGATVHVSRSVTEAFDRLPAEGYDAVVVDWETLEVEFLPGSWVDGWSQLVRAGKALAKPPGLVAVLASSSHTPAEIEEASAVAIVRREALDGRGLVDGVERAIERSTAERPPAPKKEPESSAPSLENFLIGTSDAMRRVLEQVRLVAPKDTTVLITGETGTGKERISRAIHLLSRRYKLDMVSVNCAGIPATLLEDEFFGHVKGAFTDARQARVGRFEQAHGSTVFLDEIGDLPLELQPKLLRVLQEREIHRIGAVEAIQLNVRVIAATNVDLWRNVEGGRFREDLFYRINVFHVHLPPLRERPEDIPQFIRYFLDKLSKRDGVPPKRLRSATEAELTKRPWRGNIRELENAVEIAFIRSQERGELTEQDFPPSREAPVPAGDLPWRNVRPPEPEPGIDFKDLVQRYERDLILRTLELTQGNKNKAAQMLRLKRTTLIEKLKRFDA